MTGLWSTDLSPEGTYELMSNSLDDKSDVAWLAQTPGELWFVLDPTHSPSPCPIELSRSPPMEPGRER